MSRQLHGLGGRLLAAAMMFSALFTAPLHAAAEELKKEDLEKMLTSLESLRKAILSQRSAQNATALKSFKRHAASPTAANQFYMDCLKKLRFTDEGKRAEAWREYRDDEGNELNTNYHRAAKQLELRYIILSIEAARAKDRRDLMPALISFIDDLLEIDGRGFEHIDSADGSIFTEAYEIQGTVDPGDWQMDPTNISGIYDSAILPHMRLHKDERLVTAWTKKIEHSRRFAERRKEGEIKEEREEAREERRNRSRRGDRRYRAEANAEKDDYETFLNEELPELKWAMCDDLREHGFVSEALPLMMRAIKEHPEFPGVTGWLTEMEVAIKAAMAGENPAASKAKE